MALHAVREVFQAAEGVMVNSAVSVNMLSWIRAAMHCLAVMPSPYFLMQASSFHTLMGYVQHEDIRHQVLEEGIGILCEKRETEGRYEALQWWMKFNRDFTLKL